MGDSIVRRTFILLLCQRDTVGGFDCKVQVTYVTDKARWRFCNVWYPRFEAFAFAEVFFSCFSGFREISTQLSGGVNG